MRVRVRRGDDVRGRNVGGAPRAEVTDVHVRRSEVTVVRSAADFAERHLFNKGGYDIHAVPRDGSTRPLLRLHLTTDDEQLHRSVPRVELRQAGQPEFNEFDQRLVLLALVRSGVRHPGLLDEDLRQLHRDAYRDHHIELFTDLNAITTGLLQHVIQSLDSLVSRIIVSSSSISVLHEYQSALTKNKDRNEFLRRAEMSRVLRVIEEVRQTVPVHIHQLPPGSTRYYDRKAGGPSLRDGDRTVSAASDAAILSEETTYISEDRQMIDAFWHYLACSNPRLPIRLVTSDFNLAHVCVAERVPVLFARSPYECWKRNPSLDMRTLWFDPFALSLHASTPHELLWELCLSFGTLNVIYEKHEPGSFSLRYDPKEHLPANAEPVELSTVLASKEPDKRKTAAEREGGKPNVPVTTKKPTDRPVKLALTAIVDVLPTRPGQRIALTEFKPIDEEALRQLKLIGETTQLYHVEGNDVVAGASLEDLLASLSRRDYIAVNALFRRHPHYDRVLHEAELGNPFPNSKVGGAATNWAILLGAAYKVVPGARYGLAYVTEERFEGAVIRAHTEIGEGNPAASLPKILDSVCTTLQLSPVRFEAMLDQALGRGALRNYDAQRATVDLPLSSHSVLVSPSSASPQSYLRKIEPGRGVILRGTLQSSLVRRDGVS